MGNLFSALPWKKKSNIERAVRISSGNAYFLPSTVLTIIALSLAGDVETVTNLIKPRRAGDGQNIKWEYEQYDPDQDATRQIRQ